MQDTGRKSDSRMVNRRTFLSAGKHAGDVVEAPISPKDVLATAFHLLGIDPDSTFPDPEGREQPITGTGRLRPELLG